MLAAYCIVVYYSILHITRRLVTLAVVDLSLLADLVPRTFQIPSTNDKQRLIQPPLIFNKTVSYHNYRKKCSSVWAKKATAQNVCSRTHNNILVRIDVTSIWVISASHGQPYCKCCFCKVSYCYYYMFQQMQLLNAVNIASMSLQKG